MRWYSDRVLHNGIFDQITQIEITKGFLDSNSSILLSDGVSSFIASQQTFMIAIDYDFIGC